MIMLRDEFLTYPGLILLDAVILSLALQEQKVESGEATARRLRSGPVLVAASLKSLAKKNLLKDVGASLVDGERVYALTGLALNLLPAEIATN